jgi:hypothetical protein
MVGKLVVTPLDASTGTVIFIPAISALPLISIRSVLLLFEADEVIGV